MGSSLRPERPGQTSFCQGVKKFLPKGAFQWGSGQRAYNENAPLPFACSLRPYTLNVSGALDDFGLRIGIAGTHLVIQDRFEWRSNGVAVQYVSLILTASLKDQTFLREAGFIGSYLANSR